MRTLAIGILIVLAFAFSFSQASNDRVPKGLQNIKPNPYDCRVTLHSDDLRSSFEADFVAEAKSSVPDSTQSFSAGDHVIHVKADRKWMTLQWFKGTERIAQGVFVWSDGAAANRAAILYDPKNIENQIHFTCTERPEFLP